MLLYTPAYIFSLIFFVILLITVVIIIYNLIYHFATYLTKQKKIQNVNIDDYPENESLDYLKNTDSYNSAIKVALNNKNKEIFQRDTNKSLKDLLAFKFENDTKRINHQINQLDLSGIDNSETKALNTFKTKINVNSINPDFDDYMDDIKKENERGLSVVSNLMNPSYYLVNPLNKIGNKDVLNVKMPEDVNLNQVISDKIDAIIDKKLVDKKISDDLGS
jgi:hypothetical protein